MKNSQQKIKLCIVGLGYVGLPIAIQSAKKGYEVIGYDYNSNRVSELKNNIDSTHEVTPEQLRDVSKNFSITNDISKAKDANFYIVTVPTPVDGRNIPDLRPLESASKQVASVLEIGNFVVYESTVYPGVTEEVCIPILEHESELKLNKDFFCGYSPERVVPGDKARTLEKIIKITSGSNESSLKVIDDFYKSIIDAGTYPVANIKIAEAAKVIENTQRDVNIALINELAMIFNELEIDTKSVLEAAGTKWNFIQLIPGLVGGHCIGVDPYYLTYKASNHGISPNLILASRQINDNMHNFVANNCLKILMKDGLNVKDVEVLILGTTFKENCPDYRNTKVVDLFKSLDEHTKLVDICDPLVDQSLFFEQYKINLINVSNLKKYDLIILAVPHNELLDLLEKKNVNIFKDKKRIVDLKGALTTEKSIWRL